METTNRFTKIAFELENAGLKWVPSIGDEICFREEPENVSILVDPNGLSLEELQSYYLWLPTVEQMVFQIEVRQAVLAHAGLELSTRAMNYVTVIESSYGKIKSQAKTLRGALGITLRDFLLAAMNPVH